MLVSLREDRVTSTEEKILLAKEREKRVLEYMRNMDEAKQMAILEQIEHAFMPIVALKQLDGNSSNMEMANSHIGKLGDYGHPLLGVVPMDAIGIAEVLPVKDLLV